jgi:Bacterial extracellular solute-binding protein
VVVSYGGSSALAKQIEAGAPADIFISADVDWMDHLDQRHLLAPRTRTTLLRNALVLIAPASSSRVLKIGLGFPLATALGGKKLAMANPESWPSGRYGKSALEALGVWASVERQVVPAENVRVALALVSRGEAAYGFSPDHSLFRRGGRLEPVARGESAVGLIPCPTCERRVGKTRIRISPLSDALLGGARARVRQPWRSLCLPHIDALFSCRSRSRLTRPRSDIPSSRRPSKRRRIPVPG